MIRSTTNGTLKTYRYSLQRSSYTMNKARETVQTQRQFNSFAEDPAAAAKALSSCAECTNSFCACRAHCTAGGSDTKWARLLRLFWISACRFWYLIAIPPPLACPIWPKIRLPHGQCALFALR